MQQRRARRVLVIVVASGNQITHKMIETEEPYETAALEQAAQYVKQEFSGLTLLEAREAIIARMHEDRLLYDALLARALRLAQTGLDEVTPEDTLHVQGVSFLFEGARGSSADRDQFTMDAVRALFKLLEEKRVSKPREKTKPKEKAPAKAAAKAAVVEEDEEEA